MRSILGCRRAMFGAAAILCLFAGTSANAQVRISQVYGGGGNAGAIYTHDFIELFNAGSTAVDLNGMSVQYASATGSNWAVTPLGAFMLQPGQYYLVQEAMGNSGSQPLPTPDAIGTLALAGGAGKVALVSGVTALTGTCPTANVVDFVGFGATANCFEGSGPTPAPGGNANSVIRNDHGCSDTDSNAADFVAIAAMPRNSSTINPCGPSTSPTGVGSSTPADACINETVILTVAVMGGANPPSTGLAVSGDLSAIGGAFGTPFLDDGNFPDAVAGDLTFTTQATVQPGTLFGTRNIPVDITDAQSRTGNASVSVVVLNCNPSGFGRATPPGACNGDSVLFTVDVNPGIRPDSTGITVVTDMSALGGAFDQQFVDNGTNGDVTANDTIYSYLHVIPANQPGGLVTLVPIISDMQGRVAIAQIDFTPVPDCTDSTSQIVISQIYGGGGNMGGVYRNDFIELFNRTSNAIDITGWSVQYASGSSGSGFLQKTDLAGTIPAGGYYLVWEAAGSDMSQPELPTADATGTLMLGGTAGRVALVRDGVLIDLVCDASTVEDLVGYGSVLCFEGIDNAETITNSTGIFRVNDGCRDTNQNVADLFEDAPAPRNSDSPLHFCGVAPTTGACCLTNGSCVSNVDTAACASMSGAFQGVGTLCSNVVCPQPKVCPCDWNNDSVLNSQDFFDFLGGFFTNAGDYNDDGVTNSQDYFDFLGCFFAPPASCL